MATDVVTGIDSLLSYINKNGEKEISALATVLEVNEGTIFEWSTVLEKAKLVVIVHKLGKMYVGPTKTSIVLEEKNIDSGNIESKTTNVTMEELKRINDVKSKIVQEDLNLQQKNIELLNNKIKEFKTYIESSEKALKENEPIVKNASAELLSFKTEASKNISEISEFMNQLDGMIERLKGGNFEFSREYLSFENVDVVSKNARAIIDDIRNKSSFMRSNINDIVMEFDKRMTDEKNRIIEFRNIVKKDEKELDRLANSIQKQLSVKLLLYTFYQVL